MKQILSTLLAIAMLFSLSLSAFSASVPEGDESNIKVSYSQGETDPDIIYSVQITWGSLEFNYESGLVKTWNPNTLKYEITPQAGISPAWTPVTAGGDQITVINHSNTAINASVSYTKNAQNGVDGTVQNGTLRLPTAVGTDIDNPPTATATLTLSTQNLPESFTEGATNVTVGSVIVTITQDSESSDTGNSQTPGGNAPSQTPESLANTTVAAQSLSGSGTEASPYLINNGADLLYLSQHLDLANESSGKHYQLNADINVTADTWTPIKGFAGIFDGNGHTVSGGLHATDSLYAGVFSDLKGTVKDLTVSAAVSTTHTSNICLGGIVGFLDENGSIENCTFSGTLQKVDGVLNKQISVGGIVGKSFGTISGCTNNGTVYGADATVSESKYVSAFTGGIVGWSVSGSVYGCTHSGTLTEGDRTGLDAFENAVFYTGRIAGLADSNAQICACNTATADASFPLIGNGSTTPCPHS